MHTPSEIRTHDDIKLLVDSFYIKVRNNSIIGFIFNDVAKVNWDKHLPVMYSFWESMLLGAYSYGGNPMVKHIELSKMVPLTQKEFSEWLRLFCETVDELFVGEVAETAKLRAHNIARLMLAKIRGNGLI